MRRTNDRAKAGQGAERARALARARAWLERDLWQRDLVSMPTFRKLGLHTLRVGFLLLRGLREHQSFFRAAALTYITVLSLVPLLAFAFALAKGFGAYDHLVQNVVAPFLDNTFGELQSAPAEAAPTSLIGQPVGSGTVLAREPSQVRQVFERLLGFVASTNVANLGAVGLVVLLFTVLKLMAHIEDSFNTIWGVNRSRTLVRKFADYLSIVLVTPLLLVAASAMRAALATPTALEFLREKLMLGPLVELALRAVPFLGLWLGFSVLGLVMPNTRVRLRSALVGGFVGAVVWSAIQFGYVRLQWGVTQYNALYAGFAAIPLFLVWVWLSWIAVLLAAEVSYADQHSEVYMRQARGGPLSPAQARHLGVALMVEVTERFRAGLSPVPLADWLARYILPERELVGVLDRLETAGLVARLDREDGTAWTLARDPDRVHIADVYAALDGSGQLGHLGTDSRVELALEALHARVHQSQENLTLGALVAHASSERASGSPETLREAPQRARI